MATNWQPTLDNLRGLNLTGYFSDLRDKLADDLEAVGGRYDVYSVAAASAADAQAVWEAVVTTSFGQLDQLLRWAVSSKPAGAFFSASVPLVFPSGALAREAAVQEIRRRMDLLQDFGGFVTLAIRRCTFFSYWANPPIVNLPPSSAAELQLLLDNAVDFLTMLEFA